MDTTLLQDLTALFRVLNTPFGVAVLAIIALGILPKIPRLRDYFGINQSANANGAVDDLKPVLSELTAGIAKISGNDLSHIQKSIDNISAQNHMSFRYYGSALSFSGSSNNALGFYNGSNYPYATISVDATNIKLNRQYGGGGSPEAGTVYIYWEAIF